MELLDQYLEAVRKHLPWEGQDDIIAELGANLEAQLEDKEAQLGRPLTKQEAEEWLKQIGPPIQVAGRYQRQQYLIGPALFPTYWYTLRLVLAWCAILYSVAKVLEIAAKGLGAHAIIGAALGLPSVLLISAAFVTLAFAIIEAAEGRFPGKILPYAPMARGWSAADLRAAARKRKGQRSFAKSLAEVIFGYVFFAWLLLVPHYPFLLFGVGVGYLAALPYKLAPVWWYFYWCLVAINGFELAWKTVAFVRHTGSEQETARHIAMKLFAFVPLGLLLSAPGRALFLLKNPVADAAHGAQLDAANNGIHVALAIAIAIIALQFVWMVGKVAFDARRKRLAAR